MVCTGLVQRESLGLRKDLKNFPKAWPLVNKGSQEPKHLLGPGEGTAGTKPLKKSQQQGFYRGLINAC